MYVGSQAETEPSCRLKIRSQQAFLLMTVSLDNSPLSQSLQPGKINGIAALKCHEGRFEISGVLLTFMSPPISFQFPVSDHHRRTLSAGGGRGWRGVERYGCSFFHALISLLFHFVPSAAIILFFVLFVHFIIQPSCLIPISHTNILIVAFPASSGGRLPSSPFIFFL